MPRRIELQEARIKAARFCSFRERSPKELADKLKNWGLHQAEVESIISEMLTGGFVDPQRFANAYCNDKFEFNSWGKLKIKSQIYVHQLDPQIVENALKRIDEQKYYHRLLSLATRKWELTPDKELLKKRKKTLAYLASKGYELELINKALNQIDTTSP